MKTPEPIEIREVTDRNALKQFISLPEKIHQDHYGWIPPIYSQEWNYFNPQKNRAFSYSDCVLALAYTGGKPAGRIMGIINKRCNEYKNEKIARFGFLECWDNQAVAHELLLYIEKWAKEKGMTKIVGPMGFNNQDPAGFLVQGFEYNPTLSTYCNFDYINHLLAKEEYLKEVDYVVYKIDMTVEIPEFYSKLYNRIISRADYKDQVFKNRKQIKPFIIPILELMNESFADLYGFQPLDNTEMRSLAKRFLPVLDPRFVKVVTKNNKVIGFNIAMPNLSDGIKKAKGRLFPFGIFYILRAAKRTKQLDSLIGGISKEYRGRGIDIIMGYSTMVAAQKAGFQIADSHHELEDNNKVRAEMERLGGEVYKRFRIYKKDLQTLDF